MNNITLIVFSVVVLLLVQDAGTSGGETMEPVWESLINGSDGMNNFNRVGSDVWSSDGSAIQAVRSDNESSYLVSENSYTDFILRVEFWASTDANSGVFVRCENARDISSSSCYEVNIYDQRPEPEYGTGSIVHVAETTKPMPRAGGRWNTFEITLQGNHLRVDMNGKLTAEVEDNLHADGVIALQWRRGVIRFRKVEIRRL